MNALVLLACVLGSKVLGLATAAEVAVGYHERVGVPTAARIRQQESMRIAGGLASYLGEHPYFAGLIVALTSGQTSVCGGTLLNHYRVLTTGLCWWDGNSQAQHFMVVLGSVTLFSGGTRVRSSSIITHPEFDPYNIVGDIAIIYLPYVSYTNHIKPILLPYGLNNTFVGTNAEVIGFGKTSDSSPLTGQGLCDVYVPVISNAECSQSYGSIVRSTTLCTSGDDGRGPCGGDAGGPLIWRFYSGNFDLLIGLASFGPTSGCESGYPSGYTRVTSYMDWINSFL